MNSIKPPISPYPAPWEANIEDTPEYCQIEISAGSVPIAYVRNADDMEDDAREVNEDFIDAEARATARLMAAAPELLAACELLLSAWESPDRTLRLRNLWHKVRAAITKARGE
jgi:hypothetical protein